MDDRYIRYNEVTFLSYCFVAINRAINHAREKKERLALRYVSINDVDETILTTNDINITDIENSTYPPVSFDVYDRKIVVQNSRLAIGLRSLVPFLRNTLLLEFFAQMNTSDIAKMTGVSKRTVERRRTKALERLHESMEVLK